MVVLNSQMLYLLFLIAIFMHVMLLFWEGLSDVLNIMFIMSIMCLMCSNLYNVYMPIEKISIHPARIVFIAPFGMFNGADVTPEFPHWGINKKIVCLIL